MVQAGRGNVKTLEGLISMAKRKIIEKVKNFLVESLEKKGIDVDKMILFGSYARGNPRRYSDIDLIIVSKYFRDKDLFEIVDMTGEIEWELVRKTKKPFDIMYYSDREWRNSDSNLIINAAKNSGKVIYSAKAG